MRSNVPIFGNPWPHNMRIGIDAHSHLIVLLYVKHAWRLARDRGIPDLDPVPRVGDSAIPPTASPDEWTERWNRHWQQAWAWFASDDPVPPYWQSEFGRDGIDLSALSEWDMAIRGPLPPVSPEHDCLDALIPAWRAGIDTIVVLPYRGYYVQRLSHRHLAVSRTTRDDPELYRRALATIR
ncbi:hypothetical protein [Pseudactinotalea sp.]|uniref:hypothetical protein n=1 Tax=Pseudactinotalea sp. TaxID=1926260 RepID=UPI003B3A705F